MSQMQNKKKNNFMNGMIFEGCITWTQNDTFVLDGEIISRNERIKMKGNIEEMFPQLRENYGIKNIKITGNKKRY